MVNNLDVKHFKDKLLFLLRIKRWKSRTKSRDGQQANMKGVESGELTVVSLNRMVCLLVFNNFVDIQHEFYNREDIYVTLFYQIMHKMDGTKRSLLSFAALMQDMSL